MNEEELNRASQGFVKQLMGLTKDIKSGVGTAATEVSKLKDSSAGTVSTFQKLSSVGASFSNDMAGMLNSSKLSRTELNEFADTVSKNSASLAGLGGNVSRGAEQFAKLSGELHTGDSNLRYLGYTTKEMNDFLADQISIHRTVNMQDASAKKGIIDSTMAYMVELDAMAKLTGRSREDLAKKFEDDRIQAAFEAKVQEMTLGMSEKEAEVVKNNINLKMAEYNALGQGRAAMESFITGGAIMTKEAGMQVAMGGKTATLVAESAAALSKAHIEEANAKVEAAKKAGIDQIFDPARIAITKFAPAMGALGDTVAKQQLLLSGTGRSLEETAKKHGLDIKTQSGRYEAMVQAQLDIQASQQGKGPEDEQGNRAQLDQINRLAFDTQKKLDDAAAGFAKALNIQNQEGVTAMSLIREFAQKANDAITPSETNVEELVQNIAKHGIDAITNVSNMGMDTITTNISDGISTMISKITTGFETEVFPKIASSFTDLYTKLTGEQPPLEKRSKGTFGETGKPFEVFPLSGKPVELHGVEGVFTPPQIDNVIQNSYRTGLDQATNNQNNLINAVNKSLSVIPKVFTQDTQPEITTTDSGYDEIQIIENTIKDNLANITSTAPNISLNVKSTIDNISENTKDNKNDENIFESSFKQLTDFVSNINKPEPNDELLPFMESAFKDLNNITTSSSKDFINFASNINKPKTNDEILPFMESFSKDLNNISVYSTKHFDKVSSNINKPKIQGPNPSLNIFDYANGKFQFSQPKVSNIVSPNENKPTVTQPKEDINKNTPKVEIETKKESKPEIKPELPKPEVIYEKSEKPDNKNNELLAEMLGQLKNLNNQISTLLTQQLDIGNKHTSAIKKAGSNNLFHNMPTR